MNKWKSTSLEDVADLLDCLHKTPSYTSNGYPIVRVTDIKKGYLNLNNCLKVDEINFKLFSKNYTPKKGDIVFSRVGTYGVSSLVKENQVFCLGQNTILIIPHKINGDFLFYYLSSNEALTQIDGLVAGSTQPTISMKSIREIVIPLPSYSEQESIAEVLSSLDDKIDLLQRQNKTLEQMAETLFRQWFVEEEKEDWIEMSIEDVADINPETISKKFEFTRIEYLDTGSITKGAIDSFLEVELSEAPSRAKRRVRDNDIVFSLVRPNQCHYGILNGTKPNTIVSTGFCVIRANKISPFFLYLLLTNQTNVEYFHSIAEGSTSTYPSLRPEDIAKFTFNFPPEKLCNNFHQQTSSFWDKIYANQRQIKKLISLRDMLLPKLMIGTIRVTNN